MNKILLSGMMVLGSLLSAQQLISFESTEGFTLGNAHGQQGWATGIIDGTDISINNSTLMATNISGVEINNTQAFHGVQSLKLSPIPNHTSVTNHDLFGGFYSLSTPLDANNFIISFDVKMEGTDDIDSFFQGVNTNANADESPFIYMLDFAFDGNIYVIDNSSYGIDLIETVTWSPNTWHRVKIVGKATGVEYYLDNNLIYTAAHLNPNNTTINRLNFVHDNAGTTSAFVDRIAINNEAALSVKETIGNDTTIAIYPNPTTDMLHISSDEKVNGVAIFDMTGRRMNADLRENQVDVNHLEKGNYIITVSTKKGKVSKKFIKK